MKDTVRQGFIVFEGIDGAGTTTQSRLLHERLLSAGCASVLTSEPTTRAVGLVIRRVLAGEIPAAPETVAYLFAADRSDHLSAPDGMLAHLAAGELVVCDRYKYSSLAYQTVEADPDLVADLNSRFPDPRIVFFLDLATDAAEARLSGRPSREIYERLEFQEQVRSRYLSVFEQVPAEVGVVRLDASLPQDVIAEKVWESLVSTSIVET